VLLGALNPFAYYFILFGAYRLLPAQIAQPINYTWPVILTVFSVVFLKQKATFLNYAGILISFGGAVLITLGGRSVLPGETNIYGVLLAFLSAFVWAIFWTLNLKDERPESVKLFFDFLFGTVYISAVFFFTRSFVHINPKGILPAVYVGIFEMGITYFLFIKAIKISNSSAKISNFAYLSPFLSLIFISAVLRERILFSTIIGLSLIIFGIIIGNSAKSEAT
jgi:drug/metabolite transporter (DMT)-like permease